jgi:hypothetical protein
LLFARGPWQFVEHDTAAHRIPRARGPRARARYAVVPDVGPRRHVEHPGTHGTKPFARGVERGEPIVARMFANRGEAVLRAVF